ncbi:MAG: hypothetical protein ACR2RA_01865, partial [Geminicoccaceae bacterium]
DEEKLVFLVMLVPMKLTLHHTKSNDAIIDLAKRLVEPRILAGIGQALNIDCRQMAELLIQLDIVGRCSHHFSFPPLPVVDVI